MFYGSDKRYTNWQDKLGDFGFQLVTDLGHGWDLPTDHNPIVQALKDPNWVEHALEKYGKAFNRTSLSRVATICQMVVFDAVGGPEQDHKPKALRRHWYQWFKVDFAQPFSVALGEDLQHKRWGLKWAGRLSTTYGTLVDNDGVTYKDLWVEDASRMMSRIQETLFNHSNILVAVEKDSLFKDFLAASTSLGATCLLSGKGKNSKAAVERALRDNFGWSEEGRWNHENEEYEPVFTYENPLYIITISDYDYDGEAVIGPTFGTQSGRYSTYVREARVGIQPEQVIEAGYDLTTKAYQVKTSNSGSIDWAGEKALFVYSCDRCGQEELLVGIHQEYSTCCGAHTYHVGLTPIKEAFGLEVEAMRVSDYSALLVHALLRILPFDYIIERLRNETHADAWQATEDIKQLVADKNPAYQRLLEEAQDLEDRRWEFTQKIEHAIFDVANEHKADFPEQGDTPPQQDFVNHVVNNGYGPWRPFEIAERTQLLVEFLVEDQEEEIDVLAKAPVNNLSNQLKGILEETREDWDADGTTISLVEQALKDAGLID